jgi:hypothetical protein
VEQKKSFFVIAIKKQVEAVPQLVLVWSVVFKGKDKTFFVIYQKGNRLLSYERKINRILLEQIEFYSLLHR